MSCKILILLASYNGADFIEQQVRSIMEQQTEHEVFLRIRDDGSKDRTVEIVEKLMSEYKGRIELIKGENMGSNRSFIWLLNNAHGYDYYAISDQDDVWLPDKVDTAINYLEAEDNNIPLLYASRSYLVEDDMVPYGETREKKTDFTFYNTIVQNICPGHNETFNNALLDVIKKNDIDGKKLYVYDSWIMNLAFLYGKILFNNEPHTYYRQHKTNQFGYGGGKIAQLFVSGKHAIKGDGSKYSSQIAYFVEKNREIIEEKGYAEEIDKFLNAKSFASRFKYILACKLYRQRTIETIAFKLAYLFGMY